MKKKIIYFDYQSAKPVDPRVVDAMMPYFTEKFGNPSALHAVGDEGTKALDVSRVKVADYVGADKSEIIFTSSATESNNLALIGYAMRNLNKGNHIIIGESEHISIHNIAKYLQKQGFVISFIPLDQYGKVKINKLEQKITDKTIMVSVQLANNEIGTIQPIDKIAEITSERKIALHSDAVAAEGLLDLDVQKIKVDLMSLSSNDIYGPKGVGALYVRKGIKINPLIIGGGQEEGLRSGSENVPGIVGFAKAAELIKIEWQQDVERFKIFRDELIREILKIPKSYLNGHPTDRLANNAHFRFEGIEGESILLSFKDLGIAVSTGSACSSKTLEPSHTLIACGLLHEEAHGSLELTVGRYTTQEDVKAAIDATPGIVERLRKLSPLYKE